MAKKKSNCEKRVFIDLPDKLYLAVRGNDERYLFAYLEGDDIVLAEDVEIEENKYCPLSPMLEKGKKIPVEYPTEGIKDAEIVSTSELFRRIKEHIYKYVDLPEDELELGVFFVMFTWFYRKSSTVAYLRFMGDSGKGKSRMLTVLGDLCFYPLMVAGTATRSAIMRVQERFHGTLVLDEADLRGDKENDFVKYINAGFERRKIAIMSNRNDPSKIESFDPFSPKIFAMREPFQDAATEGRILSISPYETTRTDIPPVLPPEYYEEAQKLRDLIAAWAIRNWANVNGESLDLVRQLPVEPRLKQLAAPLSTILPLFGNSMDNIFVQWLLQRQKRIAEQRANSKEGTIFNTIVDIVVGIIRGKDLPSKFEDFVDYSLEDDPEGDGKIVAITPAMLSELTGIYTGRIGSILSELGFTVKRKTIKIGDKKIRKRFVYIENTKRWVEDWRKYRPFERMIEVPDILKDSQVEYESIENYLQEPTEIEIKILESEMCDDDDTVICKFKESFWLYSEMLGRDVLLREGVEIRCNRSIAEDLSLAEAVDILEGEQ